MHKPSPQLRRHAGPGHFHPDANRHQFHESEPKVQPDRLAAVITSPAFCSLVRLGCSGDVLRHALHRFAIACSQPTTAREAFKRAGIDENQIRRRIAEAESLLGFIRRLQLSGLAIANDMPPHILFPWRKELEDIATWLRSIRPWQPDPMEAVLVVVLHIKKTIGKQRLPKGAKTDIVDLFTATRDLVGAISPALGPESFEKSLQRMSPAARNRAHHLMLSWELLSSFPLQ